MRNVTDKQAAEPVKRSRGRPRSPDAMSNAERQAAWRARHRAEKSVTVTKNIAPPADVHDALQKECERLRGELAQARRELARARRELARAAAAPGSSDVTAFLERAPSPVDAGAGERSLTISGTRFFAVERLAAHFGLSSRELIERMTDWADDAVSRSLDDDAAFNRYIDRRNGKDGLPSALPHGDRRSSHVTGANPVRSP